MPTARAGAAPGGVYAHSARMLLPSALHETLVGPPAAAAGAPRANPAAPDKDSHGRMDHPNKTLIENG